MLPEKFPLTSQALEKLFEDNLELFETTETSWPEFFGCHTVQQHSLEIHELQSHSPPLTPSILKQANPV